MLLNISRRALDVLGAEGKVASRDVLADKGSV